MAEGGGITVQGASVRNEGVLEAKAGQTLSLTNLVNASLLNADVGGVVSIAGAFINAASGVAQIGISGTAPTAFGRINVSGLVAVDGTIKTVLFNGFVPLVGQTFVVLTYGTRNGTFATVVDGDLGDGVGYTAPYNLNDLTINAVSA